MFNAFQGSLIQHRRLGCWIVRWWSTLFAGALLLLISFTTNYGVANLSRFRRLPAPVTVAVGLHLAALATLNWRPVYDIEQKTRQLRIETEQLREENRRLAELESRMDALLLNGDYSSQTAPATGSN
jgi:hypothetical protein